MGAKSGKSSASSTTARFDLDVELIVGTYTLGGIGRPRQSSVPVGRMAVLSHNHEVFDHDGMPEVYLPGETIARSRFRRRARCVVAELAEWPGIVTVALTQPLAGISLTDRDVASAKFLYQLRLEDPIKLLSREPKWMEKEGPQRLKARVESLIDDDLYAAVNDNIHLWSHPDVREVAGSIFTRLDLKLKAWGLRLESEVPAFRVYPPLLYEVTLQLKASEQDLLKAEGAAKTALLKRLGVRNADLVEMRNTSAQVGAGAGLFVTARDRKDRIDSFVEWLASEEQGAVAAAGFLRAIGSGEHPAREVELVEQVVLSACRNPVLGLGEWGDTEQKPVERSR